MSHLLATTNPEAAAEADSGWQPGPAVVEEVAPEPIAQPRSDLPLPGVGNWVVYHLRSGDSRNRRTFFPALVMATNEEAGTLMLWVVVDDGDTWMREHVRARVEPEDGWELVRPHSVTEVTPGQMSAISRLAPLLGSPDSQLDEVFHQLNLLHQGSNIPASMHTAIDDLQKRVAAIESRPRPGRPPKSKD